MLSRAWLTPLARDGRASRGSRQGRAVRGDRDSVNRNRTTGEIRHILTKSGGRMADAGAVHWMFHAKGVLSVPRGVVDEETLLGIVLDAGAEDVDTDDPESYEITTPPSSSRL